MPDYEARLVELRADDAKAWTSYERAVKRYNAGQANISRCLLLEIAERYPLVTGFQFEGEYEYDDEGGYFWSPTIVPQSELDLDKVVIVESGESMGDTIREELWEARPAQDVITDVFRSQSEFVGEVSLDELREDLG